MTSLIWLFSSSKRFVNSFSLVLYPSVRPITSLTASRVFLFWVEGRWCAFYSGISLNLLLWLLIVTGVVSLSLFSGFKFIRLFYDQFSNRHCHSIRLLLPWIMAFCCHFVMPLIMTVQVPAILYILQLPRDSVIGSFRWRYPSISLQCWRLIRSCFKETLSQKTLEFEGDLSVPVVLRVELSLYCLGSSYQIQTKL